MAKKIVNFPGVKYRHRGPNAQPQADVISALKEALVLAKQGELQAVGIIGVFPDTCLYSDYQTGFGNTLYPLIVAASGLHYRMTRDATDDFGEEAEDYGKEP